jgi:ADP-heptose:LPS heptosyltransferase
VIVDQSKAPLRKLAELIKEDPKVRFLHVERRGLPHARNVGIAHSKARIILFLDDDEIAHEDLLKFHFENYSDPRVGGVGGRLIGAYEQELDIKNLGRFRRFDGKVLRGFASSLRKEVEHLPGGNMSFRKEVFERIGLFDERFGGAVAAGEETDFCLRARKAGFKLIYEPRAIAYHKLLRSGGCRDERFEDFIFWHGHNYILFARSHMDEVALSLSFLQRIIRFFTFAILHLNPFLVLKGFSGILKGLRSLRGVDAFTKRSSSGRQVREILVMRLGGIGEIIAITPALRALRKKFPRSRITLLAESPSFRIIEGSGLVDKAIFSDRLFRARGLSEIFSVSLIKELLELIKLLRLKRYELFLSFQHLYTRTSILKPLLICLITRPLRRVGFNSFGRGFFLTDRIRDERGAMRHFLYRNEEFLKPLGIKLEDFSTTITLNQDDEFFAKKFVNGLSLKGELLIGISPGSSRPATRWDKRKFSELLGRILWNYHAKVILFGTKQEQELCEHVRTNFKGSTINLAGQTTLGELSAIIKHLSLFIANDSGPLHIAYHFKVPTIGIFRPGEYPLWGTYLRRDIFKAIYKDVDCAPCYRYECKHHECMQQISVVEVYKLVEELLGQKGKKV